MRARAWTVLALLAVAAPAAGAATTGVDAGTADYSARASAIASAIARRSVSVVCATAPRWRALASTHRFDPQAAWAMTPFHWDARRHAPAPGSSAIFAPRACRFGARFHRRPTIRGARLCAYGKLLAECGDWESKLFAVHVLTHEAVHLAGERDEGRADCRAVQLDASVAVRLGAEPRFALAIARELWSTYVGPALTDVHGCRDEGALDLYPGVKGWPTPPDALRSTMPFVSTS